MALIYLDAWCIKGGPHGVGRYGRSLVPRIVAAAPQHEFVVLRPRRATPADRLAPDGCREVELPLPQTDWATLAFRPVLEPTFRRYGRADVYHSLFHMLPLALRSGAYGPRAVVLTLFDVICLDYPDQVKRGALETAWSRRFDRAVIPYALRHAQHVICISEATRQRAAEWVPFDRSTTVHLGVDGELFDPVVAAATPLPPGIGASPPYLAAFGVARPYKNVGCIVRGFATLRERWPELRLVLVGGDGGAGEAIRTRGLEPYVSITPAVSDAELRAIVAGARALVVASRVEGFGLPVLEAMALGTPVVVSAIPVLREVAGDAAAWFDPDSPEQLASAVEGLRDEEWRAELIARGRARAATFTWSRTASETVAVYGDVLARATA